MGWNGFFKDSYDALNNASVKPARIVGVRRNSFILFDGKDEYQAVVSGRFFHDLESKSAFPVIGDWVLVKDSLIKGVLPRQNALSRGASGYRGNHEASPNEEQMIAANIDTVFIVCGLDGDYNIRRIERYLTLVYGSGCNPVIILNKCDLCDEVQNIVDDVESVAFGVGVHLVSAKKGIGIEKIETYLTPGKTVALIGSSGVGKSTIVNMMAGVDIRETSEVRGSLDRGVHTTTQRDLIRLSAGGMIIDNPGLREIAFWDDEGGIDSAFPEIDAFAKECRFSDCSHLHEPGCRVQEAVLAEELPFVRFESYLKMKRELSYLSDRQHKRPEKIERERWKKVAVKRKAMKKERMRKKKFSHS